ncbi:MAG TPA: histidine kinase [Chryseosolibacter sp.]|nr:histidine kinase [Chryseosolibacter sp.]
MERFWRFKLDHVIFWVATVGFHMFTKAELIQRAGIEHFILESIVRNGLLAFLIYLNLLFLIPRFAQKGKLLVYALLLLGSLSGYVLLKNAHDVYLYGYVLNDPRHQYFFANTYYNFSIALFYLAFSVALHLSKEWYFQREQLRQMEIAKLNAELDYLKAQINPHFVFNSINAIYFQIDRQNEVARRSLSNFSEMLRYQLYECNGAEIPIEKEINYIKSYVAMQQMRKDENYTIIVRAADDLKGFYICPLLLIPFVENAFKHVSNFAKHNEIRIEMSRMEGRFILSVFNTKDDRPTNSVRKGIGLNNVKRRLELLYRDKHELTIDDRPDSFEVKLVLHFTETNTSTTTP